MSEIETNRKGEIGNTKQSHPKQPSQLKYWFFTWNNYPLDGVQTLLECFNNTCKRYTFQEETGSTGTPHLQGTIELLKPRRYTELDLPKQIHWEKTLNPEAAFNYCEKDDTRTGKTYTYPKPIKTISNLYPYQQYLKDLITTTEPDDRKVIWIYDKEGNKGKSSFVKYMVVKHHALFISSGKKADINNLIFKSNMDLYTCVLIDISRSERADVCYTAIEEIKNGLIMNSKYETGFKAFNNVHVIVFSNDIPITTCYTIDRWVIYELCNDKTLKDITTLCTSTVL